MKMMMMMMMMIDTIERYFYSLTKIMLFVL
jgi:hypothetical protein